MATAVQLPIFEPEVPPWANQRKAIGIIGSRRRNSKADFELVECAFRRIYRQGDLIVSGGCPTGADHFAELLAAKYGVPITIHPALWGINGRAAGFIRNTDIAKDSDCLIACVAPDRKGGTEDTIRKFLGIHKKPERVILV
jgi:hypothetical protein